MYPSHFFRWWKIANSCRETRMWSAVVAFVAVAIASFLVVKLTIRFSLWRLYPTPVVLCLLICLLGSATSRVLRIDQSRALNSLFTAARSFWYAVLAYHLYEAVASPLFRFQPGECLPHIVVWSLATLFCVVVDAVRSCEMLENLPVYATALYVVVNGFFVWKCTREEGFYPHLTVRRVLSSHLYLWIIVAQAVARLILQAVAVSPTTSRTVLDLGLGVEGFVVLAIFYRGVHFVSRCEGDDKEREASPFEAMGFPRHLVWLGLIASLQFRTSDDLRPLSTVDFAHIDRYSIVTHFEISSALIRCASYAPRVFRHLSRAFLVTDADLHAAFERSVDDFYLQNIRYIYRTEFATVGNAFLVSYIGDLYCFKALQAMVPAYESYTRDNPYTLLERLLSFSSFQLPSSKKNLYVVVTKSVNVPGGGFRQVHTIRGDRKHSDGTPATTTLCPEAENLMHQLNKDISFLAAQELVNYTIELRTKTDSAGSTPISLTVVVKLTDIMVYKPVFLKSRNSMPQIYAKKVQERTRLFLASYPQLYVESPMELVSTQPVTIISTPNASISPASTISFAALHSPLPSITRDS